MCAVIHLTSIGLKDYIHTLIQRVIQIRLLRNPFILEKISMDEHLNTPWVARVFGAWVSGT